MLTKKQKETLLLGKKDSNYRNVLAKARKKVASSSEDLGFLSTIDPKMEKLVLELLLSNVKSCLKFEKTEFLQPKRIDGGKVRLRKGLPHNIKKKLEADGDGDIARLFDGKVMVQKAGTLRNDDGSPRRMITYLQKLDFSYKMLHMIYEYLKEQASFLPSRYEPKVTLSYKDNEFNLELDYSSRTPTNQETG